MVDVESLYGPNPVLSYKDALAAERLRLSAIRFHEAVVGACPDDGAADEIGQRIQQALRDALALLVARDEASFLPPVPRPDLVAQPAPEPGVTDSFGRLRASQGPVVEVSRINEATALGMRDGKIPLPGGPIN